MNEIITAKINKAVIDFQHMRKEKTDKWIIKKVAPISEPKN